MEPARENSDAPERFEEKLAQLEAIVESLEGDVPPLDEAMAAYERGLALAQACLEQLEEAELRVDEIALDNE